MNLPKRNIIIEKNMKLRRSDKRCGHNMAFSSTISALKSLAGSKYSELNGKSYDIDYAMQIGISGEGFGFMTSILDILRTFGNEVLSDCFMLEGIKFHVEECDIYRVDINGRVNSHLQSGKPIILFYGKKYPSMVLAMGNEVEDINGNAFGKKKKESTDVLIVYQGKV